MFTNCFGCSLQGTVSLLALVGSKTGVPSKDGILSTGVRLSSSAYEKRTFNSSGIK